MRLCAFFWVARSLLWGEERARGQEGKKRGVCLGTGPVPTPALLWLPKVERVRTKMGPHWVRFGDGLLALGATSTVPKGGLAGRPVNAGGRIVVACGPSFTPSRPTPHPPPNLSHRPVIRTVTEITRSNAGERAAIGCGDRGNRVGVAGWLPDHGGNLGVVASVEGGDMEITMQYFDGCPNWTVTDQLLKTVVDEHALDATVSYQLINTPDAAAEYGFRGSPTVLIDGVDPFADPDAPVGLACRVYVTEDGLAGSPTREQLRQVILAVHTED